MEARASIELKPLCLPLPLALVSLGRIDERCHSRRADVRVRVRAFCLRQQQWRAGIYMPRGLGGPQHDCWEHLPSASVSFRCRSQTVIYPFDSSQSFYDLPV